MVNESKLLLSSKMIQKFAILYYGKVVWSLVIILVVMSNSLFSLGYIILVCILMFANKLFLDVDKARNTLLPILRMIVLPYIILEMLF